MKNLSFYEQLGIVIPGAVFLFGLIFYIPDLRVVLANDGFSVGGLGVFVLIAYAAGHLLAALGNFIEEQYWRRQGGMPSNWVIGPTPRVLSRPQIMKLEGLVKARLGLDMPPLTEIAKETWVPISRQIYSDVEKHGHPSRIDTFNGNYGLNRGLCAALAALAILSFAFSWSRWYIGLALLALSAVYLYRMHRFGVHYARELFNQFLLLPPEPSNLQVRKPSQTA